MVHPLMWWHSEYFHPIQDLTLNRKSSMQGSCFLNAALEHQKCIWPLPDHSVAHFEKPYHNVLTEGQVLEPFIKQVKKHT